MANTNDPSDPKDEDATPIPPPDGDQPTSIPEDEVKPDRPAPSIVFPGFKEVRIVGGERKDPADPTAPTPPAGVDVTAPTPRHGTENPTARHQQDDAPLGSEDTAIVPPSNAKGDDGGDPPVTPFSGEPGLTGREATMVGGGDTPPATPLTGREATMVGAGEGPTPLTGREATMVGGAGEGPTPTPLTGREATMVGGAGEATRATIGAGGATVVGDDTSATIGPGQTVPGAGGDRTPPTYGGRPMTRAGSSAAFDANWHLAGRKGPYTGETWGDFQLGGILGEGGMGAVYRAMQTSLKRRVAIKVLPPNMAQDRNLLHRFQLEAETSSRLSSPHIVQVYFIGEHDGNHYYAMEFVDGTDLYDIHKDRKDSDNPISPEEASEFILQAARGLAEAGRYGVVHRDIKPPNLMVDKSGLLKIADFGIVKVLGEHNLTMTGQAVGTPAYCSPEQGRGDGDIDQRSDLYSLGVVFYELATGKKPFEATTPNALIYKHCFDEPELPKLLNASISNEIQAVILRLLQKKPENRYQSADELVRDLEALKTGAMLESALANIRGTGASEAKREQMGWLQRHLVPVLIAAGVVVAAGGFGGYQYLQMQKAEELQARRATQELRPTIVEALDGATIKLPGDIDDLLDEYAKLSPDGEGDSDLQRWRKKVAQVRSLRSELAPLDAGRDGAKFRARARKHLEDYTALVGPEEASAQRWNQKLTDLQLEEDTVRTEIRGLRAGLIDQGRRDALSDRIVRLATLAGEDDEMVREVETRIRDFDQQVAALEEQLAVIDQGEAITEFERGRLLTALGQFSPLVGESDERVLRWRVALDNAAGRLDQIRGRLTLALGSSNALPLDVIEDSSGDLELYAALVAEDDGNLTSWTKQVENSRAKVAGLRERLAGMKAQQDAKGVLPDPVLPRLQSTLSDLRAQAGSDDPQVLEWQQIHDRSTSVLSGLRDRTKRLGPSQPDPISIQGQRELGAELERLVALAGIDPNLGERYRKRLEAEAERVDDLRTRLAIMDQPAPYPKSVDDDLLQFGRDVDADDVDLLRWNAKRDRILALRERLAVLDEVRSVPDDLQATFDALVAEVGDQAPEVQRWAPKVALIAELRAALADLLEPKPLPVDVDAKLALWAEQVGTEDGTYIRFRTKVARVRELGAALTALEDRLTYPPDLRQRSLDQLAELVSLVGPGDRIAASAARRVSELEGPVLPTWAAETGRDQFGLWALLGPGDVDLRLRYCPPGRFELGANAQGDLAEADEVAVPITISTGFWIAESELTQHQWTALIPENPSYFKGAKRPVERVAITDCEAWLGALDRAYATPGARLPTEAEWEFACRGGEEPLPRSELEAQAWFSRNSGNATLGVRGRYANPIGLFDMLGNVSEWTRDGYGSYPTAAATDPRREGGDRRVARGGSWGDPAAVVRVTNRIAVDPSVRSMYLGFRPVIPAEWDVPPDGAALLAELSAGIGEETWTFRLGGARIQVMVPKRRMAIERSETAPAGTEPVPDAEPTPGGAEIPTPAVGEAAPDAQLEAATDEPPTPVGPPAMIDDPDATPNSTAPPPPATMPDTSAEDLP